MKIDKYDRQIRLWGKKGQQKLTLSKVALLGADGAGIEALKNLVLPGVGRIDIWDNGVITQQDLSLSFFYSPEDVGQPKAQAAIKNLLQMNPLDVSGKGYNKNIAELLNNEQMFQNYSLIIACNLKQETNKKISELCYLTNIPVIFMTIVGFYIYIRNQKGLHFVQSQNNTSKKYYMRLHDPFPSLKNYSFQVDIVSLSRQMHEAKSQEQKKHMIHQVKDIPYPIILVQVYHHLPANERKKAQIMSKIKQISMPFGEDYRQNFNQAASRTLDLFQTPDNFMLDISILDNPSVTSAQENSPLFLIFLRACKQFYLKYNNLPQPTKLPDMHTTTQLYLELKNVYKQQHEIDVKQIILIIQQQLKIQKSIDFSDISQLVDNIQVLDILHLSQYKNQLQNVSNPNLQWESPQWRNILVALRAYKIFEQKHGICPTLTSVDEVLQIAQELKSQYGFSGQLDKRYVQEICRVQGKTTISMNSISGAIAGQQAIKLLTNCFTPIKDGYLYSGITSEGFRVNL